MVSLQRITSAAAFAISSALPPQGVPSDRILAMVVSACEIVSVEFVIFSICSSAYARVYLLSVASVLISIALFSVLVFVIFISSEFSMFFGGRARQIVFSSMKRALPFLTSPFARFGKVASYRLPTSSTTCTVFSNGCHPPLFDFKSAMVCRPFCAVFCDGCRPLHR